MPTKQASRTVLVKKVRNRTWAGNQRMQASSRNRMSTLIRNRSPLARKGDVGVGSGLGGRGLSMLMFRHPCKEITMSVGNCPRIRQEPKKGKKNWAGAGGDRA